MVKWLMIATALLIGVIISMGLDRGDVAIIAIAVVAWLLLTLVSIKD